MVRTMGIGFGLPLLGLHLVSMLAFSLGLLFLIFWVWKTFSGPQLKRWGLWLLILGFIGCALTVFAVQVGAHWMGNARFGGGMMNGGMMQNRWYGDADVQADDNAAEEEEGLGVWTKLQNKEMTCAQVTDEQFELLGEYFMGQMAGDNHAQMNQMMKGMMGDDAEERMHELMGKRMSGCETGKETWWK